MHGERSRKSTNTTATRSLFLLACDVSLSLMTKTSPHALNSEDFISRAGAVQEALKVTNAAEELDPQNASVLALKAAVLLRLKDDGGAVRTANRALQIDPAIPTRQLFLLPNNSSKAILMEP
jgi:tetratricopeptide (TPR) repeat protein